MKEIKAIVQPFMLEKVLDALRGIEDLPGLTVSEVRGFGRTRGRAADAAADSPVEYVKKAKVEVVVPDALAEKVVRVIEKSARTGNIGDGKIFVHQVDEVIRIRTGERGEAAM
jgi:nitrogen regulatory protein P-II 1